LIICLVSALDGAECALDLFILAEIETYSHLAANFEYTAA
jgi:hypothetical protein